MPMGRLFVKKNFYYLALDSSKLVLYNLFSRGATILEGLQDNLIRVYNGKG
jgi:hypothetical protein